MLLCHESEDQNNAGMINARSPGSAMRWEDRSENCLTAISVSNTNSYERVHDESMLSMSSAPGITQESSTVSSTVDSSINLTTKLSSFSTQSTHEDVNSKLHCSSIERIHLMQNDNYDVFANKLITRLINNLRAKHLREDEARVILLRRGETVSEVFPNWITNAFDDSNLYVPYDLNMPHTLQKRERHSDFLVDPPMTNIGAHFAAQLGFAMTQNLPTMVYSAPEMAVIETAQQFIGASQTNMKWLVEPGLVRYFSSDEHRPIFTVEIQHGTVCTMEEINDIIGKETIDEFENRIAKVISKLQFPRKTSTVVIAEDCVINAIVQKFIRNGNQLTTKQRLTITKRIPQLALIHFDIDSEGRWKPSSASLPGLQGATRTMFNQPDINFLTRPTHDF
ncbi:unnamed protein product [Litomosoides sigmodontis]|uniref:Uncharacterized protein n=1 Tax=Litomosoides sigmodontis TaxID=42156 RepID=A0A3P6SJ40_LITSI|nr:unnamed protein product [Litomosoides sigmodontis]